MTLMNPSLISIEKMRKTLEKEHDDIIYFSENKIYKKNENYCLIFLKLFAVAQYTYSNQ